MLKTRKIFFHKTHFFYTQVRNISKNSDDDRVPNKGEVYGLICNIIYLMNYWQQSPER